MEQMSKWWNFFYLCGSASITLVGLLFVGVSLGSALINRKNLHVVNAYLSPICHHFLHVFLLCCLAAIPNINNRIIGLVAIAVASWRLVVILPATYSILRAESHEVKVEFDFPGWINVIILPMAIYIGMTCAGAAFLLGIGWAISALAASCLALLLCAAIGAWNSILRIAATLT